MFGLREHAVLTGRSTIARGQLGHPQRAAADIADPSTGGIRAWIQRLVRHLHLAHLRLALAGQVRHEDPARQGEHGDGEVTIAGVAHDSARLLPRPLPACLLLRRQVALGGAECERVGGEVLGATAGSSTHRQFTGSVPLLLRRNTTRQPSGEILNARGIPSENRRVAAYWRGKLSVMSADHSRFAPGRQPGRRPGGSPAGGPAGSPAGACAEPLAGVTAVHAR